MLCPSIGTGWLHCRDDDGWAWEKRQSLQKVVVL
jgi:hypothetical protein